MPPCTAALLPSAALAAPAYRWRPHGSHRPYGCDWAYRPYRPQRRYRAAGAHRAYRS